MSIEFKGEVSITDEAFALHSVRHILDAWTTDHGARPRPGRIRIEPGKRIRKIGRMVGGYYRHIEQLMVVASGRWWTLPSLYHELCHMNYAQYDVYHKHKKWPWWNRRGREINREIRRCWRSWWWRGLFCTTEQKPRLKRN